MNLDPRILSKLTAFAQRRRKLILIRGAATAFAMLLATMLIVAAIDYFFVLPDGVRYGLSAAAYLAVIIAEWRTCLRLLAHAPGPKRLARLFEHAEPKLREDLLSAVELGSEDDARIFDSPQFRELLQQNVANRMDTMDVERLLPVNLVRRTIFAASAILVAVIVLFVVSGFQLGTLMLRALMPGVNLARVSKTQVEIVSPSPAETLVPHGDAVPLLVKLSGVPAREAWLETFTESEGRQKVKLTAVGKDQFAGTIQVGREDMRYRVKTGDALTKKYLLDAEARPYVVKFTKTFRQPAYTKAAPRTVTEDGGDLIAIEGTEVDLSLETNQSVKHAELRIEQGKGTMTAPLTAGQDGRLSATVRLDKSGTYRVHLVGAKTGFENKFDPEYELRAEPDLVPKVEFTQPRTDLILPANDIVDLAGEATDDQGLARIEQHIRVNDGGWKKEPLAGESGLKTNVSRRWDLYASGAKAGDLITTKLVAFDMKGNKGESRPIQITITAAGVQMKRIESLDALVALHHSLKLWRGAIETLQKAASETRQRFEQTGDTDPQRAAALAAFTTADVDFEKQHADTIAALATALRGAQAGHQSADLVVLGRRLAKVEAQMIRSAKLAAAVVGANPAMPQAREMMRDADDAMNRANQQGRATDDAFRVLLNGEEADLLAENAQILSREQKRLAELARSSGDNAEHWQALGNRVKVVLSETKGLEEILTRLSDRGLGGDKGKRLAGELRKLRETVDRAITERGMTRDLLAPTLNLAEGVTRAERSALELRAELEKRPVQVVRDMRNDAQPSWMAFNRLVSEVERLAGNKSLAPERVAMLQSGRWDVARDGFKVHGDFEEIRPGSDAEFVSDVRATTAALEGLRVLASGNGLPATRERITALDRAFRLLEGAHDLQELLGGLGVLAADERWEIATPGARTTPPRDWGWIESRWRDAPGELGRLDLREEAIRKAVQEAQRIVAQAQNLPAFRDIDREMNERRRPDYTPASARVETEMLAAEVKRALDLLKPHVEAAREQLKQIAPKLSEYAQALKKQTEEVKEETKQQEAQTKEKSPEQAKADAEKALAQQEQLNQKLDALKDQLRADANKQDVLQADQRERARDADDALAMIKDPPPAASNALKDAAEALTKDAQQQALAQAAEQQQKLEQALEQIAKHYEALEQGQNPQETRTAMRAMEEQLGIKQQLDEQFAKAERMAQLARSSPEEMLKQLEKALPINPMMQQELSGISQVTLTEAQRKLEAASKAENRVAQNLSQLAQQERAMEQAQQAAMPPQDPLAQAQQNQPNAQQQGSPPSTQPQGQQPQQPQAGQPQPPMAQQNPEQPKPPNAASPAAPENQQPNANAPQNAQAQQQPAVPANPQLAQAGQQQEAIKETAAEAGADVQRAGRHEQRLENAKPGEQLAKLGAEIAKTAAETVPAAQKALTEAQRAQQAQQPVAQANQELANQAAQLDRAIRGEAMNPQVPDLPQPGQMNAAQQQMAQEMAKGQAPQYQATQAAQQQAAQEAQQAAAAQQQQATAQTGKPQSQGQQMPQAGQPQQSAASQAQAGQQQPQSQPGQQQAQAGTPQSSPPGQPQSAQAQAGQPQAPQDAQSQPAPPMLSPSMLITATPQEQVWMARTLDALDAALNAPAGSQNQHGETQQQQAGQQGQQQQAQNGQPQQNQQGQQQQGQPQQAQQGQQSQAMQQAQNAMQQAQQAAQNAMRQARSQDVSPTPQDMAPASDMQAKSEQGALAQTDGKAHGALPDAAGLKVGDWGKLPKQMAEQLTRGQGEAVAPEYREQVSVYYRALAEKAKK